MILEEKRADNFSRKETDLLLLIVKQFSPKIEKQRAAANNDHTRQKAWGQVFKKVWRNIEILIILKNKYKNL